MRKLIGHWLSKLANKKVVQRLLVGILGDTFMLAMGLVVAYYIRIEMM